MTTICLDVNRQDEPLGLAFGLRPVWSGELVLHPQGFAGCSKLLGPEGCTVGSQQAYSAHAQPRVIRHRVVHKLDGFVLLLVPMHGGEGDARMVVDGRKQRLPACTLERVASVGHVRRLRATIDVGGVKEIDTRLQRLVHDLEAGRFIDQLAQNSWDPARCG